MSTTGAGILLPNSEKKEAFSEGVRKRSEKTVRKNRKNSENVMIATAKTPENRPKKRPKTRKRPPIYPDFIFGLRSCARALPQEAAAPAIKASERMFASALAYGFATAHALRSRKCERLVSAVKSDASDVSGHVLVCPWCPTLATK
jgi:hypothetical protein